MLQHTEQESRPVSGDGRNASRTSLAGRLRHFRFFLSCGRIGLCRLRHSSSEERDGSPTRTLPTQHSPGSGRESTASKMFSVETTLLARHAGQGRVPCQSALMCRALKPKLAFRKEYQSCGGAQTQANPLLGDWVSDLEIYGRHQASRIPIYYPTMLCIRLFYCRTPDGSPILKGFDFIEPLQA